MQRKALRYDKGGDQHYDYISAWIKSTRGSDPDASLYYLAAMLEGGEDARFIARRMVILASEDIGNADPQALQVAVAAAHAVEHVGLPECTFALAQAAIYLSLAPKSNAAGQGARRRARAHPRARRRSSRRPPLRSAAYPAARALGRGSRLRLPARPPGPRQRPGAPARGPRGPALLRPGRRASCASARARCARERADARDPRDAATAATLRPRRPAARRGAQPLWSLRAGRARGRATSAAPRWRCSTSSTSSRSRLADETGWPRAQLVLSELLPAVRGLHALAADGPRALADQRLAPRAALLAGRTHAARAVAGGRDRAARAVGVAVGRARAGGRRRAAGRQRRDPRRRRAARRPAAARRSSCAPASRASC